MVVSPVALHVDMPRAIGNPVAVAPLPTVVGGDPVTLHIGVARANFVLRMHGRWWRHTDCCPAVVGLAGAARVTASTGKHAEAQDEGKIDEPCR